MTPERIAELRRLAEAATKGPWELKERGDCVSPCPTDDCEKPAPVCAVPGYVMHGNQADWWEQWVADGDFIAAAREAVPALLDDVDRLEAENAALKARVEKLVEAGKQLRAAMIRPCADAVLVEKFEVAEEKWREVTVLEIPLKVLGGLEMAAQDRGSAARQVSAGIR